MTPSKFKMFLRSQGIKPLMIRTALDPVRFLQYFRFTYRDKTGKIRRGQMVVA